MPARVFLTEDAVRDLEALHDYVASHDGPAKADYLLQRIEDVFISLDHNPSRGAFPAELLAVGLREYREVFFKPYRIIYRVIDEQVYVMLVADGRRDMEALLQRRLLRG